MIQTTSKRRGLGKHQYRSTSWQTILLVLMTSMFTALLGCSTGTDSHYVTPSNTNSRLSNNTFTAQRKDLLRQGKFTEAAMLVGLHTNFDQQNLNEELLWENEQSTSTAPPKQSHSEPPGSHLEPPPLPSVPSTSDKKHHLDGAWHTKLGWTLLVNGNYPGAAAAYREALRQNETLANAYLGLGITLRVQGQIDEAVEAYQKALAIQPSFGAAMVHLGYIYADGYKDQQDLAKAKSLFHQASQQGDLFATIALLDLKSRK